MILMDWIQFEVLLTMVEYKSLLTLIVMMYWKLLTQMGQSHTLIMIRIIPVPMNMAM